MNDEREVPRKTLEFSRSALASVTPWVVSLGLAIMARIEVFDGSLISGLLYFAGACAIFPPLIHLLERDHRFTLSAGKRAAIAGVAVFVAYLVGQAARSSDRITEVAEACLLQQAQQHDAKIRNLETSGLQSGDLSDAQKLNGVTRIAHFHMTFAAKANGKMWHDSDWQDYDMYMTATVQNGTLSIGVWLSDIPLFLGFGGWSCERKA